jgi:hypothetical protein
MFRDGAAPSLAATRKARMSRAGDIVLSLDARTAESHLAIDTAMYREMTIARSVAQPR